MTFFQFIKKSLPIFSVFFISLISSCSEPFPKGHLFELIILQKLLPKPTTATTTTPVTTPTPSALKYIFVTVATHNGNFDNSATIPGNANLNGIDDADKFCQAQKTANFSSLAGEASEYKAFLVDNIPNRRACSTANCSGGISENIDWVLKPNTDYYRLDGSTDTKVFTTNASGIVNFNGGATLLTAIDSSGLWWTGMANDWAYLAACNNHSWRSTSGQGSYGTGGTTGSTSVDFTTTIGCTSLRKLICVRQ